MPEKSIKKAEESKAKLKQQKAKQEGRRRKEEERIERGIEDGIKRNQEEEGGIKGASRRQQHIIL